MNPVKPAPVGPVGPVGPVAPAGPVGPATPDAPVGPAGPVLPLLTGHLPDAAPLNVTVTTLVDVAISSVIANGLAVVPPNASPLVFEHVTQGSAVPSA